ncbi:hypothetical protein [Mesorhizobium australicum]|uniref:Uncharacterized protein n=1 Tax=Mesorhizobium australicum TaxID=536018 RepID=A0A1X7NFG8_9HYPH|nr:hypothetical protein [Mesorhizobium australicum]SMH36081.1 hypothetical protein SAMN02982922_1690 [Mesorhizobium australicum]
MTGASETIEAAAHYLVETPLEKRLRPTVPLLADMFGLPPAGAVAAIRRADQLRREARYAEAS